MRFLTLIVAVAAFVLVQNKANSKPQGGASVAQKLCVFSGRFCSGKFTTDCCTKFCKISRGKKDGVCPPDPKTCVKFGSPCQDTDNCCTGVCRFRGGQIRNGKCGINENPERKEPAMEVVNF